MKINELELCLSNVLPTVRNIVYTMTQFICKKEREKERTFTKLYLNCMWCTCACGAFYFLCYSISFFLK